MRKFLSLVLALVMMMSLVTINAGAKEFTDGDDITYQEAVDVISTIHVVDGYNDGDFKPGNNLSRGAAAKIICNMILGPTTAAELHADTAPYRDVPVTSDFAGYIAYCQKEGIISGYADGTFRPAGTLTGYAFMKMLLGALGYDAEIEGYTGPNWSINVAKKAIGLGLNKSLEKTFNGVDFVTREEAALYAFNTLKADLVEYSSKITANVNGAQVTVGNSNAEPQKWESQQTRSDNIYKDGLVQFAEQYFNKLVLNEAEDCFGRPDREWKYDGDEIGAYINMDLFKQEYTTEVTGRNLYDLLGSRTVDEYHFNITIDGEVEKDVLNSVASKAGEEYFFNEDNLIRSNTKKVGGTGNGVLTQVFVNNDKDVETVWIAIINTYLAKASDDYDEKKDEADFTVWDLTEYEKTGKLVKAKGDSVKDLTVSGEDFDVEDVKEDDILLVHVAEGEIKEFIEPEVINETSIEAFKKDSYVSAKGEQYDYADTAMYDSDVLDQYDKFNMKDTTYRIFLDEYGYAIGVDIIEDPDQYVFLTGIDGDTSNLRNKTAEGFVIHTDGTSETVKINMEKSKHVDEDAGTWSAWTAEDLNALMNTWCSYTTDKNGVYTLTEIANDADSFGATGNETGQGRDSALGTDTDGNPLTDEDTSKYAATNKQDPILTIDKKHVSLSGITGTTYTKVYGNDDTVYLSAETALIKATDAANANDDQAIIINGADSVTTGVQNVNLKAWDANTVVANDNVWKTNGDLLLSNVSNGVYTLFDDSGYVIAAVVVGEDEGTTTAYAYVTSGSMNREAYDAEDDEYTWNRDVIINGEKVTLVEKGDQDPYIKHMNRNEWWEVKYNAAGEVRKATKIDFTAANSTADAHKFISEIMDVEPSLEDKETVVLFQDMTDKVRDISVKKNTLQIDNNVSESWGFAVAANAKIVLVQDVEIYRNGEKTGDKDLMADITYYDNGAKGLEKMVRDLNDHFQGYLSAVFEGGPATSVVVYDVKETDVETGGTTTGGDGEFSKATVNFGTLEVTDLTMTDDNFKSPISDALDKGGYSVTGWDTTNNLVTTVKDGVVYTFDFDTALTNAAKYWTVSVDDKVVDTVADGAASVKTWANVKPSTNAGTGYLDNDGAYADYGANADKIATGVTEAINIKVGYVEVEVTEDVDVTGATTNWAGTTATIALADGQAAYAKAGVATNVSVTMTIVAKKTTGAVNVAGANGEAVAPATIAEDTAIGAIATPFVVSVPATNAKITIELAVTE